MALFLLKIALNKGLFHFRQLARKLEHFESHSFGLPINISISFRKLPWICTVENEIFPFPTGKKNSLWHLKINQRKPQRKPASTYGTLCSIAEMCFTYVPCAAGLYRHRLFYLPSLPMLLFGMKWWKMYLDQDAAPYQ